MNRISLSILEDMRSSHLMLHIFCFALGIALYFIMPFEPGFAFVAALLGAAVLLWALSRALAPCDGVARLAALAALRLICGGVALGAAGFSLMAVRTTVLMTPMLTSTYTGPVSGVISQVDQSQSGALRVTLDVPRLHRSSAKVENIRFSLRDTRFYTPQVGDYVTAQVTLFPPSSPAQPYGFDFRRYAFFKSLSANGYARSGLVVIEEKADISGAQRLANHIETRLNATMSPLGAGFSGAIFLGRRAYLDPEMKEALRQTNLSHLLAISGLHVGILTGFVFMLTRRGLGLVPRIARTWPVKKLAAGTALMFILGYLQFTGHATATQRAVFMASIALIAVMVDLRILNRRNVVLAAFLLLGLRPESLLEQGFQMSFSATLALVIGFQTWGGYLPKKGIAKFVSTLAVASFLAGAATAPFVAYHFNIFSKAGFAANLLVVPIMSLWVMPVGLVAIVVDLLTGLTWLYPLVDWGIWLMFSIARWISQMDHQLWRLPRPDREFFFMAVAIAYLALVFGRKYMWVFMPMLAFMVVLLLQDAQPQFLVNRSGTVWAERDAHGHLHFNSVKKDRFTQGIWLQNNGQLTALVHQQAQRSAFEQCIAIQIENCDMITEVDGPFASFRGELVSQQKLSGRRPWSQKISENSE